MAPVVPNPARIRAFRTEAAFEKWMAAHHDREPELWLKIHKKGSGLPSVTAAQALDVAGYNYKEHLYEEDHRDYPGMIILGTENSTRAEAWLPVKHLPYISGQFLWTGIDYLGEPSPYHNGFKTTDDRELTPAELHRSSHYGIVGLDGIPKDRFHLYCAYWNQSAETAHLVPDHWNLPVDQRLPVMLYTSGDEAELFLNGRSLGRRRKVADVPGYPVDHDDAKDNENAESWDKHPYYAILPKYRLIWNDVASSASRPKVIVPRQTRETRTPALPSRTYSMGPPFLAVATLQALYQKGPPPASGGPASGVCEKDPIRVPCRLDRTGSTPGGPGRGRRFGQGSLRGRPFNAGVA